MLRRIHEVQPGYDCRVICKHEKKGEHGICGDEWLYAVTNGKRAVSFTILSTRYPDTVTPRASDKPTPTMLRYHEPADDTAAECPWLDCGWCTSDGSYFAAAEVWKAHGDNGQPEQGEPFWLALEALLED